MGKGKGAETTETTQTVQHPKSSSRQQHTCPPPLGSDLLTMNESPSPEGAMRAPSGKASLVLQGEAGTEALRRGV